MQMRADSSFSAIFIFSRTNERLISGGIPECSIATIALRSLFVFGINVSSNGFPRLVLNFSNFWVCHRVVEYDVEHDNGCSAVKSAPHIQKDSPEC